MIKLALPGEIKEYAKNGAWIRFDTTGSCWIQLDPDNISRVFETGATTKEERISIAKEIAIESGLEVALFFKGYNCMTVRLTNSEVSSAVRSMNH